MTYKTTSVFLVAFFQMVVICFGAPQGWTPHLGEPPPEIVQAMPDFARLKFPVNPTKGMASVNMPGKRITIRWTHTSPDATLLQQFPVSYWPTAITALDAGDGIVVAGKRRNGNTVVEVWKLQAPSLVTPTGGGAPYFKNAVVLSIDEIYDEATQGRDMVSHLIPKSGQPTGLIVQFFDSHAVYDFSFPSGAASFVQIASPITLSGLSANFTFSWSRDHKTRGIVYVFRDENTPDSTIVFIDANRDHVIDSAITVTDSAWVTGNWADNSNYN